MTVYYECNARFDSTSRETLIRKGWGTTQPAQPQRSAKGRLVTKVEVFELTADEAAAWADAGRKAQETCFHGFR